MKTLKEKIWIVVSLVIVAAVSTFLLEFFSNLSKPIIQKNKTLSFKEGVLTVFHIPYEKNTIEKNYVENILEKKVNSEVYYVDKSTNNVAFLIKGMGFWAPIKLLIAIENNLQIIFGLYILEQEETPGLGARIEEPWFLKQFEKISFLPKIDISNQSSIRDPKLNNHVDAITGATMTSKALEKAINSNLSKKICKYKR